MCQGCVDAVEGVADEHGFKPTEKQVSEFLWSCTCFPFGSPEQVKENAQEAFGWLEGIDRPDDFGEFLSYAVGRCEEDGQSDGAAPGAAGGGAT